MLELMARGGMRIGEGLNHIPAVIQERTPAIKNLRNHEKGHSDDIPPGDLKYRHEAPSFHRLAASGLKQQYPSSPTASRRSL